jgi:predicted NBD/HSP70 family sugar kinase
MPRATPPLLKHLNERAVLEAIRGGAPISRAEIARRTGISKPTVSQALRSLVVDGLVRETAPDPGRPHYGAVFFEPVPEAALVLALDIGARFMRGAVGDLAGNVRARQDVPVPRTGPEATVAAVVGLFDALVAAAGDGRARIGGAVIGIPGVVDPDDSSVSLATNVPGIEGHGFAPALREALQLPVQLENDINLAALGEQWRGVARGVEDFLFLSVGTGLGAGLVLHGEVHRGRKGAAGELDYAFVGLGAVDPSADAVVQLATELAAANHTTTTLLPPYEPREIFAAARSGDALGSAIVREEARRIALHVMPVAAVADVELVVLGGGLGANGDLLLTPIRAQLAEALPFPPRVEVSALGEAAVLTGALAMGVWSARENLLQPRG